MARKRTSFQKIFLRWSLLGVVGFIVFSSLPVVVLKWIDPPTSSFMIWHALESEEHLKYDWVDRQQISKYLAIAAVASEDQKFTQHFGFDFGSIQAALEENSRGKGLRGASTITQQVAKNLFLWNDRNLFRKGLEAYFTILIELFWDKPRILEVYLNIAEMGEGIYGVQAASKFYFYKDAKNVSLKEACLLIAVLPSPKRYQLSPPSKFVANRAKEIEVQIKQLGGFEFFLNN